KQRFTGQNGWIIEQDRFGIVIDQRRERIRIRYEAALSRIKMHRCAAVQPDKRFIAGVAWGGKYDFIALHHDCPEDRVQSLTGSVGDDDFAVRVIAASVGVPEKIGDTLP